MQQANQRKKRASARKRKIVQTLLTWGHVITMSVLALAVVCNVGGMAAIVFRPEVAETITKYADVWQPFFIAGILGYDAKSTVENAMKITKAVKGEESSEETENG